MSLLCTKTKLLYVQGYVVICFLTSSMFHDDQSLWTSGHATGLSYELSAAKAAFLR